MQKCSVCNKRSDEKVMRISHREFRSKPKIYVLPIQSKKYGCMFVQLAYTERIIGRPYGGGWMICHFSNIQVHFVFCRLLLLLLLSLLLLKKIGNARPGEGDCHPISPKTPVPHYQPIEEKKRNRK